MIDDSQIIVKIHCSNSNLIENDSLFLSKIVQIIVQKSSTFIKFMSQKISIIFLTKIFINNAFQKSFAIFIKSNLSLQKIFKERNSKSFAMLKIFIFIQQMQKSLKHEKKNSQLQYMQVNSKNENQKTQNKCINQMKIKFSTFDQNTKFFAHFIKIMKSFAFFIKFIKSFAFFCKFTKFFVVKNITFFVIFNKIIKSFVIRESYNDVYDDFIIQKKNLSKSRVTFTFILMSNNHNIN